LTRRSASMANCVKVEEMTRTAFWTIGLALALAPAAGLAQQDRGPHDRMLAALDADGDGAVSESEMLEARAAHVAEMDADGDGNVSQVEFAEAFLRRMAEHRFRRLDADGDGVVTEAEFGESARRLFALADRDGDGAVTADEMVGRHHRR